LKAKSSIFSEPSQSPFYRDAEFFGGVDPISVGVDPADAMIADLTADLPDNLTPTPDGNTLGNFQKDSKGRMIVRLYGDLKRHDMGPGLAESIDEDGIPVSVFLTKELWGVGSTEPYLHDGRATTLTEAILEHGGEAEESGEDFKALSTAKQAAIIAFLNNLVLFKAAE
jgi:hypothetical protein